jgi:hypothetical protein
MSTTELDGVADEVLEQLHEQGVLALHRREWVAGDLCIRLGHHQVELGERLRKGC